MNETLTLVENLFVIFFFVSFFSVFFLSSFLQVEAFRPPPTLSIPLVLDCGCCLIGAKETVTFKCTNYGGAGRFRLLPEDQWPHPSGDAADASQPMRLAPFLIEPAEFELLGGETVEIQGKNF